MSGNEAYDNKERIITAHLAVFSLQFRSTNLLTMRSDNARMMRTTRRLTNYLSSTTIHTTNHPWDHKQ